MLPLLTSLLALAALIAHRASLLMLLLSVELSSAALYWCSMLAGEVGASILTLALSLLVVGAAEVALGLSLLMLLVLLRHGAVLASSMLLVGSSLPVKSRSKVLFPDPFGPTTAMRSPFSTKRSTSSNNRFWDSSLRYA